VYVAAQGAVGQRDQHAAVGDAADVGVLLGYADGDDHPAVGRRALEDRTGMRQPRTAGNERHEAFGHVIDGFAHVRFRLRMSSRRTPG